MEQPTILNVICPRCTKAWLTLLDERTYHCLSCGYIMFERQVKVYAAQIADDIHKAIYISK